LVYQYDLISLIEIYLANKVMPGPFGRPVPKTRQRFFIDDFNDDDNNFPPFGLIH